jgi:5'-deoxynucleotidase YfbR-like HD superfamily hydrolase
MSKIKTLHGHMFDYANPSDNNYDYNEISTVIARELRFANHLHMDWTVGQHALLVHKICCLNTTSIIDRKLALHHDDLEAYFLDLPTPLKYLCPDYRRIYGKHEFYYYTKILNLPPKAHESKYLSDADTLALHIEDVFFGSKCDIPWHGQTRNSLIELDETKYNKELISYVQKLLQASEYKIVEQLKNTAKLYRI